MTNKKYTEEKAFLNACSTANVKATIRQASKFRRGKGAAYKIAVLGDYKCHVPEAAKLLNKGVSK